jgi:hypothetical protein
MALRTLIVTLVLTIVLAVVWLVGTMFWLGNGGILFLAILGGAIIWILPGLFTVALPAGAFGGVLLTQAEHPANDDPDEDPRREIVRLALFTLVVSMLLVGWILPMGFGDMSGQFDRYRDGAQAEQGEVRPGSLPLDELLLQAGSVPEARQELLRRAARILPSFFMPLFAGVLVMVRPRWTYKTAVGATLAVFAVSVWTFFLAAQ